MYRFIVLLSIFLLPTLLLNSQVTKKIKVDKQTKEEVQAALQNMLDTDQKYRWMIMYGETDQKKVDSIFQLPFPEQFKILNRQDTPEYTLSKSALDSLWVLQNEIDSINQKKLKEIISLYGWPDKKRFGENQAPMTIFLHINANEVMGMEEMLLAEVKAKRLDPETFAKIWDRKLLDLDKEQLYGTIYILGPNGESLPPKIRDINQTNLARKKIGLKKLKEYRIIE